MDAREMLEKIAAVVDQANVNVVFGAPQTSGEVTVIPYAAVSCGFGLGSGTSSAGDEACSCAGEESCCGKEGEPCPCAESSASEGAGGGAGLRVRPLGYIEIGPMGTTVKPIVDHERIALAGILLGAWGLAWIGLVLKSIFGRR